VRVSVVFDGAPDCSRYRGKLVVGEVNYRHGPDIIGRHLPSKKAFAMRRRDPKRKAEPPKDDGPGALTAAELAEGFVTTMLDYAREAEIDAGDAAAMAALDLICCLAVYGRAPLTDVLDTLAKAAPVRIALVKDANKRNQPPPPLGVARLGPLVLTDANPPN
jgi:hypothetical protein